MAGSATKDAQYREIVADLYARWTLDVLVDVARAVALDFIARPDFYRQAVPEEISDLASSYGFQRNLPDKHQRSRLCSPILGMSDGYALPKGVTKIVDKFHQYRDPVFAACIAYAERTIADSRTGLREAIVKALALFASMLHTFEGYSARSTYREIHSVTELSYEILRSPTVAGVFGVMPSPGESWPLKADDQRGAQLLAVISTALQLKDIGMSQDGFTRLRILAQSGREALEAILAHHETEDQFEKLVEKIYIWAKTQAEFTQVS
jgi:hypothetical protein